jgi:uncharacterized 2Fe-2S/4Fe-4S cluster protein (DUF4445 family)
MMHKIKFLPSNKVVSVEERISILQAATKAGVRINAVCGGKGVCGKCKVKVKRGNVDSHVLVEEGVLACKSFPLSDLEVEVPEQKALKILDAREVEGGGSPITSGLGLAFDIGTTTVVGTLVDLDRKRVVKSCSDYNKQINLGGDVLSRILYAKKGLAELHKLILDTINEITGKLLREEEKGKVSYVIVAGNTTMIYLLLKQNPEVIRREMFPRTMYDIVEAETVGIEINPKAKVFCIPGVSGYVGGDIVSDIIASELYKHNEVTLLIDVGTNGEVVLGNRDWIMACSSSAGPAFEGGEVKCGCRAMVGAIEMVRIKETVNFSTVNDAPPVGICGSGLIDLMAELFTNNIIDRAGNINVGKPFTQEVNGRKRVKITEGVYIEENEIKSIIRSKAAVFSACSTLLKKAELTFRDVDKVVVAGGFGNYLNLDNAIRIGLLADMPREKFCFVGNAAINGAISILLDKEKFNDCNEITKKITYIDLNSDDRFMNEYMSALFLPHTNLALFPSWEGVRIKLGNCLTTGIGSVPLLEGEEACQRIIESFEIPFWPQLPRRSFNENMYVQFSQGIPGIVMGENKIYIDTSRDFLNETQLVLQDFMDEREECYMVNKQYMNGFHSFLRFEKQLKRFPWIKGQITGPISYGLQVCDENRKPILYNEFMMDIVLKVLTMKLRWQEKRLRQVNENTILSLDEPFLSAFGSAFISLTKEQVIGYLNEMLDAVKGVKAIHCCGNTNWGLITKINTDIISFDAYEYGENFVLYHKDVEEFLERGGVIAWGIVPSTSAIREESAEALVERFNVLIQKLVKEGIDKRLLLEKTLITPSCGTGSLSVEEDELVNRYIKEVAGLIRKKYVVREG